MINQIVGSARLLTAGWSNGIRQMVIETQRATSNVRRSFAAIDAQFAQTSGNTRTLLVRWKEQTNHSLECL